MNKSSVEAVDEAQKKQKEAEKKMKQAELEIRKAKKEVKTRTEKMWDEISQMFLIGSLSGITVLGDVIREYLPVNIIRMNSRKILNIMKTKFG